MHKGTTFSSKHAEGVFLVRLEIPTTLLCVPVRYNRKFISAKVGCRLLVEKMAPNLLFIQ
jgi:hypothetical protein